jgi:hypothetical protein
LSILRFCWLIVMIMLNTFLACMSSSIPLLDFVLSWPLMIVIVLFRCSME